MPKKYIHLLAGFLLVSLISATPSLILACTRIMIDNDRGILVGRNMDWPDAGNSAHKIVVFPKGIKRSGLTHDNPIEWTSKYGSVNVSIYDIATAEGINEEGFSASLLYLPGSEYGERDVNRKGLFATIWVQFMVDQFANVNEAVEYLEDNDIQIVTASPPGQETMAGLHISLQDKTGDNAIIEYKDGKPVIHHSKEYKVLTNQPFFEEQLDNLTKYETFGGDLPIPGGSTPADRFVRANYYPKFQQKDIKDDAENRKMLWGFMNNAAQMMIKTDDAGPETSRTNYTSISDLTNMKFYISMNLFHNVVSIDMKKINFNAKEPMMFDIQNKDVHGDMTSKLTMFDKPFHFATEDEMTKKK